MNQAPFDQWARTYDRSPWQWMLFRPVHRAVLRQMTTLQGTHAVLDVGCGTGALLREIRRRNRTVELVGVDVSPDMIAVAQSQSADMTFVVAKAEGLPFPDDRFEMVTSTVSFHHWKNQIAGLREIARVLVPGGHVLLADLSGPPFLARLLGDPLYPRRDDRQRMFAGAGLQVERHVGVGIPWVLLTHGRKPLKRA